MAFTTTVVGTGQNRCAPDCEQAIIKSLLDFGLEMLFHTIQGHGRQEFSIGQVPQSLGLATDTDEGFDVIVPGLDIAVADRPVHTMSIAGVGLKIQIAPAIDMPHPGYRTAAETPRAVAILKMKLRLSISSVPSRILPDHMPLQIDKLLSSSKHPLGSASFIHFLSKYVNI